MVPGLVPGTGTGTCTGTCTNRLVKECSCTRTGYLERINYGYQVHVPDTGTVVFFGSISFELSIVCLPYRYVPGTIADCCAGFFIFRDHIPIVKTRESKAVRDIYIRRPKAR